MLNKLNTREKTLVGVMVGLFSLMGIFMVGKSLTGGGGDIDTQIQLYQSALQQLSMRQGDFAAEVQRQELLQEQLENNDVQLRTFLENECVATSIGVPSSYNDTVIPQRDPETGDANIIEHETIATIQQVNPTNLSRLLHRIATSDELVLLKTIDLRPSRRGDRTFQVRLTLSTYKLAADS